jgi:hypothetical protein
MVEFSQIKHYPFQERVHVTWNESGTIADVFFLTEDASLQFVLTMKAEVLDLMRADITAALAGRPRPTQGQ